MTMTDNGAADTDLPPDEKRHRARQLWRQDPTITGAELARRFGCEASWGRKQITAARQEDARAIAAATGTNDRTVRRELAGAANAAPGPSGENSPLGPVTGVNGKQYQPTRPDPEHGTRDVTRDAPGRHWVDTVTVLAVALVAAAASYGHMYTVAHLAGEPVWLARAFPVTVDGLALAALRRGPAGRRWLVLALVVSISCNVLAQYPEAAAAAGPVVFAWPPLALYGTHKLLQRDEA